MLYYFYFENYNYTQVDSQINNTLAFNEPIDNILWAENMQISIAAHELKCHDNRILPIDLSDSQIFVEKRELILTYKKNDFDFE